jgi:hypothetical protein
MIYHCPPPLVEHPALFVAALARQGLEVSVAEIPAHVVGTIAGTMVCFDLKRNRFRANLSVRVLPSKLPLSHMTPRDVQAFENVLLYDGSRPKGAANRPTSLLSGIEFCSRCSNRIPLLHESCRPWPRSDGSQSSLPW